MRVGFIGLGNLGYRLANNLVDYNIETFIYDLNKDIGKELEEKGAVWVNSPEKIADCSDICITCLPSPDAVSSVLEGRNGLLNGLRSKKLWIEMSTTDSQEIIRLGKLAEDKGAMVLEAPVSGGCHRASTGNISILVGGSRDAFDFAFPVLKIIGQKIIHVGEIGKASVLKVVTNFLASTHLVALGEALMVCKKSGLDLERAFEGIKASSGNSFVHETESQVILSGSYNVNFTMDLVCKDVGLFQNLVEKLGIKTDLSLLITEIFNEGRNTFGDKSWSTKIVKRLEDACHDNLRAIGFPSELVDNEIKTTGIEL